MPQTGFAQTLELSLAEGRIAARNAALGGNFPLARDLALALLEANPNDRSALIVLAAVQPRLGDPRAGRAAGARAFGLSKTDAQRYEAARLTALAAANEDRFTLNQFWLRRAAVHAPTPQAFAQTRENYRGVRARNPFTANLAFSVTPSNNVNGGTDGSCLFIPGLEDINGDPICGLLSGDAQALPGITAAADVRLS